MEFHFECSFHLSHSLPLYQSILCIICIEDVQPILVVLPGFQPEKASPYFHDLMYPEPLKRRRTKRARYCPILGLYICIFAASLPLLSRFSAWSSSLYLATFFLSIFCFLLSPWHHLASCFTKGSFTGHFHVILKLFSVVLFPPSIHLLIIILGSVFFRDISCLHYF